MTGVGGRSPGVDDDETRNLDAQRQLYGEPLGVLLRRYAEALQLTQGRLADLLGVSAPMLSQLANGRRVRFGNPAAVQRLQAMDAVTREIAAGELTAPEALQRLERNRDSDVFTSTRSLDEPGLAAVRRVFAAAASPSEHAAAADALSSSAPGVAAMLRAYGAGTDEDARDRFAADRG
jgi:transcriptional regulator with XRE-family HTH domain